MYTSLDVLCHDPPSMHDHNCARDGSSCSVTVFGDADIALDNRIVYQDHKGGTDQCGDIDAAGTFSFAPRQLEVPCEGQYIDGSGWSNSVALQSCLSWRQPGGKMALNMKYLYF